MKALELLRECHLCRGLDATEFDAIARIASLRTSTKGEILFLQGDVAAGLFVLLSGGVRIYKSSPDGKEYTLHHIRPGQMFAEAAVFRDGGFPANCVATEDSRVAFFPKDRFVNLVKGSPQISLKMIAALSAFVRDLNRQVEDLSLREVPARLAAHLLRVSGILGSERIGLDVSKTELARSLGTISETLSRNLKKLSELSLINVDGKTITILDQLGLQAVAEGRKI